MKKTLTILACLMLLPMSAMAQTDGDVQMTDSGVSSDVSLQSSESAMSTESTEAQPVESTEAQPVESTEAQPVESTQAQPLESEQAQSVEAAKVSSVPVVYGVVDENYDAAFSVPEPKRGFSMLVSAGGTYAFYETLTSGFRPFDAKAGGFLFNIDLGYRSNYFAFYVEGMFRAAFASDNSMDSHCPGIYFEHRNPAYGSICYDYKSIRKGEWDNVFAGVGLIFLGLIPVSDFATLTVGGGPLLLLGKSMSGVNNHVQFALKIEVGVQFSLSDNLSLGFTISEEGWLNKYRSISPVITFGYNAF